MPEGDSVLQAAIRLREALAGKPLDRCDIRVPQHATVNLSGEVVEAVTSRGKHLFIEAGQIAIHSHLGMDGAWHVYEAEQRWRRPGHTARIVLEAGGRQAVGFSLKQLDVVPAATAGSLIDHLGPDLLGPDWDAAEAVRRIAADPDRSISVALLDQRVMAGIGNVYRNELCFLRGLHPETPVGEVGDLDAIVRLAYRLLTFNATRTVRVTTGETRPGRELWVYGRGRKPCRRCQTLIARDGEADRVTYWCPSCRPAVG